MKAPFPPAATLLKRCALALPVLLGPAVMLQAQTHSASARADEEPCNTLPAPGATTGPDSICPGIPFLLGLANPVDGSGISYQWQQSADSMAWTDVAENGTAPRCGPARARTRGTARW